MRFAALALAVSLSASAPGFGAVVAASTDPLTLSGCIRQALAASPSLRSATTRVALARRQMRQAVAALGPRAEFTATQALLGYDNAGRQIEEPRYDEDTHAYTLTGRWTLLNNFRDTRSLKRSRLDLEASRQARAAAEQELLETVVQAYFGELLALRLNGVRRRFSQSSRANFDVTDRLYKAGVRSYTDLLDAKIQIRSHELDTLRAQRGERAARAALNSLLDRPLDAPLELADVSDVPEAARDYESDLAAAYETRPELREQRLAIDKARIGVNGAWAELFPALSLDASASYRFDEPTYSVAPGVTVSATNPYWQIGARLDFTVFDGGAKWQEVKLARLELDLAREQLESVRRRVAQEVFSAREQLSEQRLAFEMSREELKTARESLAIVMDQYRQGNLTSLQVKDAQNSLFQLEESEAQALYDAHIARIPLLKAVGTLSLESIQ